jgi:DNA-directed RNA polymerase I, II, and III subunit RPABC2
MEYHPENNVSSNILTKYEKVKIISIRAEQLARGAQPAVTFKEFDPVNIAHKELQERKLPFMIRRKLPNGKTELWKLDDMIIY